MLRTTALGIIFATMGTACSGAGSGAPEPVGTSEARVTLSASGNGSTSETLTVTSDASGELVATRNVTLAAGSATLVDLQLSAGTYTFVVKAYDASGAVVLGSGSLTASLATATTTDLKLATSLAASGGSAEVQGQAGLAPTIAGFTVDLPGQGSLSGSVQSDTLAAVHVDAVSSGQGDLSLFWSGFGIKGAVQGSSTIDLSAAAATSQATGQQVVRVVVKDALGNTAEATTTLDLKANGGAAGASASGSATAGSSSTCLDADAQCSAGCDGALAANPTAVTAHASCEASCSLALASCGL